VSTEDEVRRSLLNRINRDLQQEDDPEEQESPSFVHSLLQAAMRRGKELGHMYESEVPDYLDGTLQADRANDMRRHLAECDCCNKMVDKEVLERKELREFCEQRALERQKE